MSSERPSDAFDLGRDVPTTAADVEALRRAKAWGGSTEDYLRFLRELGPADTESLRKRRLPVGDEPFRLPDDSDRAGRR
jgi:hypothetical protein